MEMYKPYQWDQMNKEAQLAHMEILAGRVLENRYRYYVQDDTVLTDAEYDDLEKHYLYVCELLGVESPIRFVDWQPSNPGAMEAEQRVLNGTDTHSMWIKEMQPIWDRLGKPSKVQKKEERES